MNRSFSYFFFIVFLTSSFPIFAHESEHHHEIKAPIEIKKIKQLEYLLKEYQVLDNAGSSVFSNAQIQDLGLKLLEAIEQDELSMLREQLPPTVFFKVKLKVKDILSHWNPISLGLEMLEGVRRYGVWIGIAVASGEVFEKLATALSVGFVKDYPALGLVPVLMESHVLDLVVFRTALGIPSYLRLFQVWRSYGGIFKGSEEYFETLKKMNEVLGADPSQTDGKLLGHNRLGKPVYLVKTKGGGFFRPILHFLPQKIRVLLDPRFQAFSETNHTVTLSELQKRAKKNRIPIHFLETFKSNPILYATLLIQELQKNGKIDFIELETQKNAQESIPFQDWVRCSSPEEIESLAKKQGWDLNMATEFLRRNFEQTRKKIYDKAKNAKLLNRKLYRYFRDLEKLTQNEGKLTVVGDFSFEKLFQLSSQAEGYLLWIQDSLPLDFCENQLLPRN